MQSQYIKAVYHQLSPPTQHLTLFCFFPQLYRKKKNWKGWAALEIFGSILITGIHALFFFFFWQLGVPQRAESVQDRPGIHSEGGSLATRRDTSGRKRERGGLRGEREDPTVTNDYEHLLISLAFVIVQRKPGLVCTPTVLWEQEAD